MGDWHPESPARLQAIADQLISAHVNDLFEHREAPLVALSDLERNHSRNAIAIVRDNVPAEGDTYPIDGDTTLNHYSWSAAQRGRCGRGGYRCRHRWRNRERLCAIRPPGHHARPIEPMGFCLFNNVAVAAKHALDVRGLARVAVVDFDVHHGNGTEEALRNEPR
jgi:acetoin utilization deacetylase AcuC-like enzyme